MNSEKPIKNLVSSSGQLNSQLPIFIWQSVFKRYFTVFAAAAIFYILTCAPGFVWQDGGLIQYRIWHNDIQGKLGLALSHPLYYLIAIPVKYIPLGQFAHRINCFNAIICAIAIANLFLLLYLLLKETFPAITGAATLALSHTFWQHAAMPETYGLVIALMLLELIMLVQYAKTSNIKYLYLLAFINGLAIANHMLASISFVCYFVLVLIFIKRKQLNIRNLAFMILLWIIGALPYEILFIKELVQSGDLAATIASALFGIKWKGAVLNSSMNFNIIKENILYILLNFPTPNILLLFVGIVFIYKVSPKKWFANIILSLMILYFAFAFRYTVQDRYAFFIPFYCFVSILIAIGIHGYLLKSRGANIYFVTLFCLIVIAAYIKAPQIAEKMNMEIGSGRTIPYRDDTKYFLFPWKMDDNGAHEFAKQALSDVKAPAIIYADATTSPSLLLTQEIDNIRADENIKIISSIGTTENAPEFNEQTIDKLFNEKNIYVISKEQGYCPDFIIDNYEFQQAGILWRIIEKE